MWVWRNLGFFLRFRFGLGLSFDFGLVLLMMDLKELVEGGCG